MNREKLPKLLKKLHSVVAELETMFPGRHFTPDGHMIGSLGEALAAHHYGLKLLSASTAGCDAQRNGRSIEIKATLGNRVALRSCPEHLLVLKLFKDGSFEEAYNGNGNRVWALFKGKPLPSNGQHQVSLSKLRTLNSQAESHERIKRAI